MEIAPPQQPRRWYKTLLRWFLFLLLLLVVGIVALVSLLFIYENEVKAAIVAELNKHLKSEVKIDPKNIDLTIIRTFPDCSIEFRQVLMLEALPIKKRDTLLYADRLNLLFNIKDLWNKNYHIDKIRLTDGVVKLSISKTGKPNYIFWDDAASASTGDSIHFNLQLIDLRDTRLEYRHNQTKFKLLLTVQRVKLNGNFSADDFDLNANGTLFMHQVASGKTNLLKKKNLAFTTQMQVRGDHYAFSKTALSVNKLGLELNGDFVYKDSLTALRLRFKAPELNITSLLSLLPEEYQQRLNDYESSGNFFASGAFKYNGRGDFSLLTDLGVKNGSVVYKPNNTAVDAINLAGSCQYSNQRSALKLNNFALRLYNDAIAGSGELTNFKDPFLNLSLEAGVDLANLRKFWPIDTLEELRGRLTIKGTAEGLVRELKGNALSNNVKLNAEVAVSGLEAKFKHDAKLYAVQNASVVARDREITVHDLLLKRGESDLLLNGRIPGLFNYLADRHNRLIINGSLRSNFIDLDDLIPGSSSNNDPLLPDNVSFTLEAQIAKLVFGKFTAETVTGDLEIRDRKAMLTDMKFSTMEGDATVSALADNTNGHLDLTLQADFRRINISKLFADLNNFGQATLQDKQIKGYASATLEFSGRWSNALVADEKMIKSVCDLTIERGELLDFKPLLSLSKFINVADLERIRFSTLHSNISIADRVVTFPRTNIKNSALNIEFWGTHTFDNHINYHIQLLLSELLAKKRKKSDDEFGPVANDPENRRNAFILMAGTVDNPIIKYDKQGMKEKIRSDIKKEKETMRNILKEEFGMFKKDTVKKVQKAETFEIEKPEQPKKGLELKKKEEDDDF